MAACVRFVAMLLLLRLLRLNYFGCYKAEMSGLCFSRLRIRSDKLT